MDIKVKRETLVCRGCLGTGRMYSIEDNQLSDLYKTLIGDHISVSHSLSQHLCHMCRGLLLKYSGFRQRCLESQNVLLELMEDDLEPNKINPKKVKQPLFVTTPVKITEYPEVCEVKIEQVLVRQTHLEDGVQIKEEEVPLTIKFVEEINTLDIDDDKSNLNTSSELNLKKEISDRSDEEGEPTPKKKRSNKRMQGSFRMKGRYFETTENMSTFENVYDVDIIVLSKDQQMKEVLDRKLSFNYQNSPFKCEECYRGFINRDNLTKHYKAQHDPSRGDVVCEFCRHRCVDKRTLTRHLRSHRLQIVCRQCNHVSRNTFNAKEHFKMHRGHMNECKQCGKSYEKLSTYLSHVRLCHPDELTWCRLCGESFIGDIGLNGHVKRSHRDLKFPADCARCGTRFVSAAAYDAHATGTRDPPCDKLSSCAHCGRAFESPAGLRDHLLTTHKNGVKHYQCCKCNKQFARESLYSAHFRRIHANDPARIPKPWVCEVCGKSLPNKCRLMYHQRNHTGERPFQCPHCPKSFTLNKLLRSHLRVHTTERPFACNYCPKTFKGPAALRGHVIVHHRTGERAKIARKKKRTDTLI